MVLLNITTLLVSHAACAIAGGLFVWVRRKRTV